MYQKKRDTDEILTSPQDLKDYWHLCCYNGKPWRISAKSDLCICLC